MFTLLPIASRIVPAVVALTCLVLGSPTLCAWYRVGA